MYTFEKSIFSEQSPSDVFTFVTNPSNASSWQSGVESAGWTSAETGKAGSTWKVVNKFLGRRLEAELEVLEMDPPSTITSKIIDGPIPFETTLRFAPKNNGTQLTMESKGEFGGFFKLAEGLRASSGRLITMGQWGLAFMVISLLGMSVAQYVSL